MSNKHDRKLVKYVDKKGHYSSRINNRVLDSGSGDKAKIVMKDAQKSDAYNAQSNFT